MMTALPSTLVCRSQKLAKKVEKCAQEFRQRVFRGYHDEKRRDRVQSDEQEWMWITHNQLGWSYAKIGSEFNRDSRSVIKALRNFEQKEQVERQTNLQDPLIIEATRRHFSDLNDCICSLSVQIGSQFDSPDIWFQTVFPEEYIAALDVDIEITNAFYQRGSLLWQIDYNGVTAWFPKEHDVLFECLKYHLPNEKLWQSFKELKRLLSDIIEQAATPNSILVRQAAAAASVVSRELDLAYAKRVLPGKCPACPG